jgi:hypothetical protein
VLCHRGQSSKPRGDSTRVEPGLTVIYVESEPARQPGFPAKDRVGMAHGGRDLRSPLWKVRSRRGILPRKQAAVRKGRGGRHLYLPRMTEAAPAGRCRCRLSLLPGPSTDGSVMRS